MGYNQYKVKIKGELFDTYVLFKDAGSLWYMMKKKDAKHVAEGIAEKKPIVGGGELYRVKGLKLTEKGLVLFTNDDKNIPIKSMVALK